MLQNAHTSNEILPLVTAVFAQHQYTERLALIHKLLISDQHLGDIAEQLLLIKPKLESTFRVT